jgi:hypothetical protein
MKKAFIITSAIELNNDYPLSYSDKRSYFSNEERLRHTIMTIASLDKACDNETTFYLLDMSDNWQEYKQFLSYQPNLKFISIKEEFPEIFDIVTKHPQKSYCETLQLATFMKAYRQELLEYDFVFKMSGRYFVDSHFNMDLLTPDNANKIFYKKPLQFNWNDDWGFQLIDRRKEQGDNNLRQYCSVLFGWGRPHYDHFLDLFTAFSAMFQLNIYKFMDIETLGYYYTRPFEEDIIETDWLVYGWTAHDGRFMRY